MGSLHAHRPVVLFFLQINALPFFSSSLQIQFWLASCMHYLADILLVFGQRGPCGFGVTHVRSLFFVFWGAFIALPWSFAQ